VRAGQKLRGALALAALYLMATGQVGSCAGDRHRAGAAGDGALQKIETPWTRVPNGAPGPAIYTRVIVTPSPAKVGEAIHYLAVIRAGSDQRVQFDPPRSGGDLTWSNVRAGRKHPARWKQSAYEAADSVWMEARLQVFTTGLVDIPGPLAKLGPANAWSKGGTIRLPTAHVMIAPTVTSADSNQSLRGLHGPLAAPWWERLPLAAIVAVLALVVAWLVVLQKLRQRKRKPVRRTSAPVAPPARPRIDPAAEALRALFTLRAKKLPAQQRFGEHALELTAILRRFLEATVTTPRPGDTSGELLERLRASRHEKSDLERLEGLLGLWDRVKFARAPLTEEEAARCEEAVEGYVRRTAQARLEAEAAAARAAAARAAAATSRKGGGASPPPTGGASATMPRPGSGAMPRPSSSSTPRPSSTTTQRPSSATTQAPTSATTQRPTSGSTQRPASGSITRPSSATGASSPAPPTRPGGRPPERGAA
jgi:hypothetical protein